ncbi:pyrroline-5-carboxylate reductase [Schaalia sp. lx-100]|uniref:pyrroline-5-carboxylate reductase n=1 Tax=Schaalia sp. lx-100 TaxID=2899081 RepID=UPI001E3D3A68|nr:pyrroline-5-carboxylate reductase [Schaalia sp. lx-100]MCD4556677.1 pyrroline-5-carboxylate reductase [Schaalia sp. lx-100]
MRIGFIGTGSMVSAIVRGAVTNGMNPADFVVTNRHIDKAQVLADELGLRLVPTNTQLVHEADIVVLGVKPHMQTEVIEMIAPTVIECNVCIVSIAAGRTTDSIAADFVAPIPIIRVMPNVNAQIGRSMTALYARGATNEQVEAVTTLMNSIGKTVTLDEKDFPVFQALAGCSPAWVYSIIEALARAGLKYGLTKYDAVTIAAQALSGSAELVLHSQKSGIVPTQLIDYVTSPGGTTIAGLLAAEEAGLSTALLHAVDAAVARDAELA